MLRFSRSCFVERNDILSPAIVVESLFLNCFLRLLVWFQKLVDLVFVCFPHHFLHGFSIFLAFIAIEYGLHFRRTHFGKVAKPRFSKSFFDKGVLPSPLNVPKSFFQASYLFWWSGYKSCWPVLCLLSSPFFAWLLDFTGPSQRVSISCTSDGHVLQK